MPKQGQSVESCIVSEFKKKVGDSVKVGDILFGYETDKATFEEESQVEGTVLAIFYKDGDEIPVLSNVMVIGQPGESFAEFAPASGGQGTGQSVGSTPAKPAGDGGAPSGTYATLGLNTGGAAPSNTPAAFSPFRICLPANTRPGRASADALSLRLNGRVVPEYSLANWQSRAW